MQIRCRTLFDITETGVTGHFKPHRIPFRDNAGQQISDQVTWDRARNQQRNLETISQLLQLRTQIFDVTVPQLDQGQWWFDFSVEFEGIYQSGTDVFGILKQDCDSVPMLTGLDEKHFLTPTLVTDGSQQNIWFELKSVNS